MKIKALKLLSIAAIGVAGFAHGQAAPPAHNTGASAAQQAPLQLSTLGQKPEPKPIKFPPVNPKDFTATTPTVETVKSFLTQLWGYDSNRVWQVEAIQKTTAPNVTRVVVFIGEQGGNGQTGQVIFYVTPDGQHAIAGEQIIPFGADIYADARAKLEAGANGPSRGAESKKLLLVEFSDLQCPHCKEAQPTVDHLAKDFPNARIVYENFPLTQMHPAAEKAAEYGVCVAQLNGNDAFFRYVQAVFDTQAGLTPEGTGKTLKDAAMKAGADADAVKKCLATPTAKTAVAASTQLGNDVGVNQTPTLFINGRPVPLNAAPYDTIKQLVAFAAKSAKVPVAASAPTQP